MPSDLSRAMLTSFWASLCQACDLPLKTKRLPSPDDHGVEMEVFSEEDPNLTIQSARKVMGPGYGWEEHVTPPHRVSRIGLWSNSRMNGEMIARVDS